MALYDPDAAGNAAPYLRLDPVVLMEVRSAPFDGKTAVWVPYAETGYTKVIPILDFQMTKVDQLFQIKFSTNFSKNSLRSRYSPIILRLSGSTSIRVDSFSYFSKSSSVISIDFSDSSYDCAS